MAESTHNFEFYASLVNYILWPRQDEEGRELNSYRQPALKLLPILDTDVLDKVPNFGSVATVKIFQLIKRYFNQYNTIPSKMVYEDLKNNDPIFVKWFRDKATANQRGEVSRMDSYIFEPVSEREEEYLRSRLFDLAVKLKLASEMKAAQTQLSQPGEVGIKAFEQLYAGMMEFNKKLEEAQQQTIHNQRFVYRAKKNANDFAGVSGVRTQFDLVELRPNGILTIFGAAKDGKTRFVIAVCRYLARQGYDILYLDAENGDKEMDLRFTVADCSSWLGYPVDIYYFYAKTFIHEDNIPVQKWDKNTAHELRAGETVYKIVKWSEVEDQDDGTQVEVRYVEVRLYESKQAAPTLDPEYDEEGNVWEDLGRYEDELEHTVEERVYESTQDLLDRMDEEIGDTIPGQVSIDYIPSPHISQIEGAVNKAIQNPKSNFFSRPGWRVLVVDWMLLVQNKGEIWERTRDNYNALKSMQGNYQLYVMVVDGVKNPDELQKLYPNLAKVGTLGTKTTDYAVERSVLFCVSPEEKSTRTARIVAKATRYGRSGQDVQTFLEVDEMYARIYEIDEERHRELNPELWEDKPKKKGKESADDLFGDIPLD